MTRCNHHPHSLVSSRPFHDPVHSCPTSPAAAVPCLLLHLSCLSVDWHLLPASCIVMVAWIIFPLPSGCVVSLYWSFGRSLLGNKFCKLSQMRCSHLFYGCWLLLWSRALFYSTAVTGGWGSWEAYLWIVTGTSLSGVEFTVGCISITVASYGMIFKYSYILTIVAWVAEYKINISINYYRN